MHHAQDLWVAEMMQAVQHDCMNALHMPRGCRD